LTRKKTIFQNDSERSFVYRYGKAREEVEVKKKKLENNLGHILQDKWKRTLKRSSSMDDRLQTGYRDTLHNELHSMQVDSD